MYIYLYEIDINEYGAEVSLPCSIEEYILKFVLFTDGVYLQSSSCLKRNDVFLFYRKHADLFSTDGIVFPFPYISIVLDSNIESLSHYIDNRLEKLSKIGRGENIEQTIYKMNDARKRAKEVDNEIIKKEAIIFRKNNVDDLFKFHLLSMDIPFEGDDFVKSKHLTEDYVHYNQFIQTFDLMKQVKKTSVNEKSRELFGKYVRKSYYSANAEAVNCSFHDEDWHLHYNNINQYSEIIGLNRIFRYHWKLNREVITAIKSLESYHYLIDIYFHIETNNRFNALCSAITCGHSTDPEYYFYEFGYINRNIRLFKRDLRRIRDKVVKYHEESR